MSGKSRKTVKIEYDAGPGESTHDKLVDALHIISNYCIIYPATKQAKHEPNNWREVYDNIKQMRSDKTAPVDSYGPMNCIDENADEATQRFQILVSLLLSSQTKDGECNTKLLDTVYVFSNLNN